MLTGPAATIARARTLRKGMSLPEVLLWRELRQRPGGYKFRRQHPAGPFILDFACLETRLVLEIDGEAHGRGDAPNHDEARDEWIANQGFRTLRIPARDVLSNLEGVVAFVADRCAAVQPLCQASKLSAVQPLHRRPGGPPPRTGEDL
jgi:very-short-patch-repair endonuclease